VTAAKIIIARWDDWVLPQDAVCEVIARVGKKHALGLTLINQSLHNGQLELALLAPDGTLTTFSRTERKCRTVHAPLNPLEGTHIKPYEAGQHYVRGVVELTSPATAATPADRQLPAAGARAEESMLEPVPPVESELAPPTALPRVEPMPPPEPVPAADMGDQVGSVTAATETAESPPKKRLGTTGRPREKRDAAAEKMRADLRGQRLTRDELRNMKQEALAERYDCGREAARNARNYFLS